MRKLVTALLLAFSIGILGAEEAYPFSIIDHLLRREAPGRPEVVEDTVVFTVSSAYRRAGIAFAHEGFGKVHWLQKFMIPNEDAGKWVKNKPPADMYRDSGMLFYVYTVPENIRESIEYRLILDGLWASDPQNPDVRVDEAGISRSVVRLPRITRPDSPTRAPGGALHFAFNAESGETVTVAGSFNNWDPFMYELRETAPGRYTLSLPLPPGTYQYCFYYRGERLLDPHNSRRVYTREGKGANEATVEPRN